MPNDQPLPESLTVSVEPSFTSISHSNDITFISNCHSVIFQIRSMVGVPSLTVQQYPIDLSSRQCIMITKFYSFTEPPSPLVMCDYIGCLNYLEEFGLVAG